MPGFNQCGVPLERSAFRSPLACSAFVSLCEAIATSLKFKEHHPSPSGRDGSVDNLSHANLNKGQRKNAKKTLIPLGRALSLLDM
jgi:hypothetical protein